MHVLEADLNRWCRENLGTTAVEEIFRSGYLSVVVGLRLADGREVVVKVRPRSPRLAACVEVQRRLFDAGYPCPEPLTGTVAFGDDIATAETYVGGGTALPEHPPEAFAGALARLIRLAPRPDEVSTLDPAPSWAAWNHDGDGLWPRSDELDVDLNAVGGPGWIDVVARRARDRLLMNAEDHEVVIGHADWLAGNLRWTGDEPLVVHDWDSVTADTEAVLVGFAAALYSTVSVDVPASVDDTERFLTAYSGSLGADGRERAWAAGLWTRAYDAKCQHAAGQPITALTEAEAYERLRRSQRGQ